MSAWSRRTGPRRSSRHAAKMRIATSARCPSDADAISGALRGTGEDHLEVLRSVFEVVRHELEREAGSEPHRAELVAPQVFLHHDLRLHPREVVAETQVRAGSEREMLRFARAVEAKLLGAFIARLVSV